MAAIVAIVRSDAGTKLVETVSAGLGKVAEPFHRRREAKAEADALVLLAEGRVAAQAIEQRAAERLLAVATRRQENIEAIVEKASTALPESVAQEPVAPDWTARFFDACQDVADEEMRGLWGKLLAGEVAQPGSYSLRTLHALQHLTKGEAQLFELVCAGGLKLGNVLHPMIMNLTPEGLAEAGLGEHYGLRVLEEANLISFTSLVTRPHPDSERGVRFDMGHLGYMWVKPPPPLFPEGASAKFGFDEAQEISLGSVQLTPAGRELARLTAWLPTLARVEAARKSLERSRHVVTIERFPEVSGTVEDPL